MYFEAIWSKGIPFKVSLFLWRMFEKRIPIWEFQSRIGVMDKVYVVVVIKG